jgi:hypothetical protein
VEKHKNIILLKNLPVTLRQARPRANGEEMDNVKHFPLMLNLSKHGNGFFRRKHNMSARQSTEVFYR